MPRLHVIIFGQLARIFGRRADPFEGLVTLLIAEMRKSHPCEAYRSKRQNAAPVSLTAISRQNPYKADKGVVLLVEFGENIAKSIRVAAAFYAAVFPTDT